MPTWLEELIKMTYRFSVQNDEWKRVRIAISPKELEEYKAYMKESRPPPFIYAIRGFPLVVEEEPKVPPFKADL